MDYIARIICTAVNGWAYLTRWPMIRLFRHHIGHWPNLAWPTSYAEKLLWRKIIDHDPQFGPLADKLKARAWMVERVPNLGAARTLWVGTRAADIPDELLRQGVVVKANHGSGYGIVLREPPEDLAAIRKTADSWMTQGYQDVHGEWGYSLIERKLFVEEMLPHGEGELLQDYVFYCCDGKVLFFAVTHGEKTKKESLAFFRADGTRLFGPENEPNYKRVFLPLDFRLSPATREAARMAETLSSGFDFVRVDIMEARGKLYAAEMSFYPGAGVAPGTKLALKKEVAHHWALEKAWFLTARHRGFAVLYAWALRQRLKKAQTASPLMATRTA